MTAMFICAFSLLCLCAVGYSAKGDFMWLVSMTVSDNSVKQYEYEGQVEMVVTFKDKTQQSVILPSQKYYNRLNFDFPINLPSGGQIEAVNLRTKGLCSLGPMPDNVLRLHRIQLVSRSTSMAYTKELDDLAIKDSCQLNTEGTQLTDFHEDTILPCTMDGVRHEHGERFDMGCVLRCHCMNGSVECVDMCPPMNWEPTQICKFVHSPGQCCDRIVCQDEPDASTCQEAKQSEVPVPDSQPVHRYPWSAMFCIDQKCSQIQGGIIIGDKHMLTLAQDLSYVSRLYVAAGEYIVDQSNTTGWTPMRILNVTAHPDFINRDSSIADSASRLQIVEFEGRFQFDKQLQAANLPFDKDHCQKLSKNECPTMVIGWDRTDETDNQVRQWWLHADKANREENLCKANRTKATVMPKRRGDQRWCIGGLMREDCTGPLGGAVLTTAANVDYVVGLTDPDASLFLCQHPGTADVLPLCKYVDWANTFINNY